MQPRCPMNALIRAAELKDVEAIVRLHAAAFPRHFLTMLGQRFLRLLYSAFVNLGGGICVVCVHDQQIVGVAAGTLEPSTFFRSLLHRQWAAFGFAAIGALLSSPIVVAKRLIEAVWYRGDQSSGIEDAGLLSSLAISPTYQGRGVGSELLFAFCQRLHSSGVWKVYAVTDLDRNEAVLGFYKRNNFYAHATICKGTRRMVILLKSIRNL